MKKKAKRLLAFLMCMMMLVGIIAVPVSAATETGSSSSSSGKVSISDVSEILNALSYQQYQDKFAGKEDKTDGMSNVVIDVVESVVPNGTTATIEKVDGHYGADDVLKVGDTGKVTWKFDVPASGFYVIDIPYCQIKGKTTSIERVFSLNGQIPFAEARSIVLSKVWKYDYVLDKDGNDSFKNDKEDGTGNDIRPSVIEDPKWVIYTLQDTDGYYTEPFEFYLEAGENTISLESTREPAVFGDIVLRPAGSISIPTYDEYIAKHGDIASNIPSVQPIIIEAEHVKNTSSVTIYPLQDRTSPITSGLTGSQSAKVQKYNIAGGSQWSTVGEWITYEVKVTESGYYGISFRYKQDLLSGMYVSRKVYIDDQLPFQEAANCRFDYTDKWQTKYLGDKREDQDERDFFFYLEAREEPYTIKFEVALADMSTHLRQISDTLSNLNASYLEIVKLTGSNPDTNRTYNFSKVMPHVLETMMVESINLKGVYKHLSETTGLKGENTATLEQLYLLLNKMASDEREIAGNLETFKTQLGSLGTWMTSVSAQPLKVDYIQIQAAQSELPKSDGNFFQKLWYELSMFFYSFVTDYNSLGSTSSEKQVDPVEVWIAAGRDQAQVMRSLIDNDFTPKTGVSANLKLVSGGTLLPSVLAGAGPDVSVMETSAQIIDFALRSAVLPLNEFIEKDSEDVLSWFPDMAVVPLTLHDTSENAEREYTHYALPDKLNFSMLFYRKDILSQLELDIPQTWDDILAMIPVLQYNNMSIGIQNDIYTFVYQSNNEAYKNGGMQINFDNTGVLKAFTKLCNMYTQYSLPTVFDFSNRFRTGEMPIGIADYSTCNQLTLFASELSGLWGFTVLPGYEHERADGTKYINNSAIATVTGCVMLDGCENGQNAWEFMKWYVGKDCQVAYTNEMVSIQGIAGRHPTPNTEAIKEIPWTNEERDAILAQFNNLSAVPNYPGSYYLARYVNFAFLAAYNESKDPADSLLSYVTVINKEITRRRIEFGMDYIDVTTGEKVIVGKK